MVLKRFERLQQQMRQLGCDAFFIEDKINLFYFTGLELSAGTLIATLKGGILLVDGRYYEQATQVSPFPVQLKEKSSLVELFKDSQTIGFDGSLTTHQRAQELEAFLSPKKLISAPDALRLLRMVKDPQEIQALQKAAELGNQGFAFIQTLFQEGITELELAKELEIFWKRQGSKGVAFDPIIAFGGNSSMPHYRGGNIPLQPNTHILVDIGVNLNHYHSDKTRVFFFGQPDPKINALYTLVQEAQGAARDMCRPGTLIGELDKAARAVIASEGYALQFTHSLGHGVGLEIHEEPFLRGKPPASEIPLQEGMVITLEPGIYLPGIGGVRYEDTIVITSNGYQILGDHHT